MNVTSTGAYGQTAYETKVNSANTAAAGQTTQAANATATANADEKAAVYESSASSKSKTTGKTDYETINRLKKDLEARQNQMKSLVESMLKKQGLTAQDVLNGVPFKIDAETQQAAQDAISEDGYFGVEQTSDRLVEFAKGLTGGDPALVEKMRDAIKAGFGAAEEAWGGKLPSICQDTYDATMKKLDEWAKGSSASGE